MKLVTPPGPSEPTFHSSIIQNGLAEVEKTFQEYNRSLNEISSDIRTLEKTLNGRRINIPFTYAISHMTMAGCYSIKCLSWQEFEQQGFRLIYHYEMGGGGPSMINKEYVETKPLIECKADVRIQCYEYLSRFLVGLSEALKKAKAVRDKELVAELVEGL